MHSEFYKNGFVGLSRELQLKVSFLNIWKMLREKLKRSIEAKIMFITNRE